MFLRLNLYTRDGELNLVHKIPKMVARLLRVREAIGPVSNKMSLPPDSSILKLYRDRCSGLYGKARMGVKRKMKKHINN